MRLQSLMDASTTIHLLWKNTAKRNKQRSKQAGSGARCQILGPADAGARFGC